MQTSRLSRILKGMMKDRRGMAGAPMPRAPPPSAPKPAAPPQQGAKPAGGQQGAQQPPAQGEGVGQGLSGAIPGGAPDISAIDPRNTGAGAQEKQQLANEEEFKKQLEDFKERLKELNQEIDNVKEQMSNTDKEADPQKYEALEEELKRLNDEKKIVQEEIVEEIRKIHTAEQGASEFHRRIAQERKTNLVSLIPEVGAAGMVAQQAEGALDQRTAQKLAAKESGTDAKIGQLGKQEQSAAGAASSAGQRAASMPSSPTPSSGAKPSSSGGAGGGGGLSKIAEQAMGSKGGGGEGTPLPLPTLFMLILSVVTGGYIWRSAGTAEPMTIIWVLLPIVLFIAALILKAETKGHRGRLATVVMVLLFLGAAYGITTRTAPFVYGAWQAGNIEDTGAEIASAGAGLGIGATTDFRTSFNQYVASATGERVEGDVDQQVKEEVGIEGRRTFKRGPGNH